jgi:phage I-like protein
MGGRSEEERGFTAVLEQVRGHYKVLADGQRDLNRKIDQMAQESGSRDRALDQKIDLHSATLIQTINEVKALVVNLSAKLDAHERAHAN